MTDAPRYGVYYTPALDHPLWRAGCDWLGRDAADSSAASAPRVGVQEPCRYGFHATLKAPMRLIDGRHVAELVAALQALACRFIAFRMPDLVVSTVADFVALRPREAIEATHPLRLLADACVTELDPFRDPPNAADERRRALGALDDELRANWYRYGYPHVMHRWRFHMTLTDRLTVGTSTETEWLHAARLHFATALAEPLPCDAISLFVESAPGRPFVLQERFQLQSPGQSVVGD